MARNPLAAGGVFEPDPTNPLTGSYSAADAADWHSQNAADTWAAAKDPQTWQDAADQYAQGMLMGSVAPEAKGLGLDAAAMKVLRDMSPPGFRAYHGSPHSFDKFSTDKIGTGEGAQAYGHGLYLADSEGVARGYKTAGLGSSGVLYNGQGILRVPPSEFDALPTVTRQALMRFKDEASVDQGIANAKNSDLPPHIVDEMQRLADQGHVSGLPSGHMYEVNVASDPAHFLDWDKPLSEQTPHVQQALGKVMSPDTFKALMSGDYKGWTAGEAHDYIGRSNPARLAENMQAAGIPGIRYLDGGSRAGGQGTSNHVIFDPATIAILRKYGLAGLMAGGGAAAASGQPQQ